MAMNRRETAQWAKEEIADAIRDFVRRRIADSIDDLDADDERALAKERDRCLIFLRIMPQDRQGGG